jgi:hypothetical protein|tara:strand:+ start:567 stop:767 length:201 start_codon:yes stop_codon:yes gene_type:complete
MKTFSFLLKDGFRIDVKASTPRAAYNKLLSHWGSIIPKQSYKYLGKHLPLYLDYAKDSSVYGWRSL